MSGLRFIWWSLRIPSKKRILHAAERESEHTRKHIAAAEFSVDEARALSSGYLWSSVPLLFVMVGVLSGLVGSLFVGVLTHFLTAESLVPWADENIPWSVSAVVGIMIMLYVGLWADRVNQLYRTMGVGVAHGAGGRML